MKMTTQPILTSCILLATVVIMITAAPTTLSPATTWCKARPADIVFLLDASSSIWEPDFKKQKDFVKSLIDHYDIGPSSVQVAVVLYTGSVFPKIHLNTHEDKISLKKHISHLRRVRGGETFTHEAIRYMRRSCFHEQNGARDHVVKIGIVITDGSSTQPHKTAAQARLAKAEGVQMFAVGVGDKVDIAELQAIASHPKDNFVTLVNSYSGLDLIHGLLATKTCKATRPPPTTTSTTASITSTTARTTVPSITPTTTTTTRAPTTTLSSITAASTKQIKATTTIASTTSTTMKATRTMQTTTPPSTTTAQKKTTTPSSPTTTKLSRAFTSKQSTTTESTANTNTVRFMTETTQTAAPSSGNTPPHGLGNGAAALAGKPISESRYAPVNFLSTVCTVVRPVEIVFIIDSKLGGPENVEYIWNFVRNVIKDLDIGKDKVRVGFVYDCVNIPDLDLGSHANKKKLLDAFDSIGERSMTTHLFHKMIDKMKQTGAGLVAGVTQEPGHVYNSNQDGGIDVVKQQYEIDNGNDRKPIVDGSASEGDRRQFNRIFAGGVKTRPDDNEGSDDNNSDNDHIKQRPIDTMNNRAIPSHNSDNEIERNVNGNSDKTDTQHLDNTDGSDNDNKESDDYLISSYRFGGNDYNRGSSHKQGSSDDVTEKTDNNESEHTTDSNSEKISINVDHSRLDVSNAIHNVGQNLIAEEETDFHSGNNNNNRFHGHDVTSTDHVKNGPHANHNTRRRIAVYVTDGRSDNPLAAIEVAQRARDIYGIEIFTVGIGPHVNRVELKAMASCDTDDHAMFSHDYSKIKEVKENLSKQLCNCMTDKDGQ